MPSESAIVVPVPEAERTVGRWRMQFEPVASRGIPAHITVLYPFLPPSQLSGEVQRLRQLFATVRAFQFSLTQVRRFPANAYLHPEPADLFVELTKKVAEEWPEFPPYGAMYSSIIPHLTIADRCEDDVLNRVMKDVETALPIACVASEVWLLSSDVQGEWSVRETFRLGGAT